MPNDSRSDRSRTGGAGGGNRAATNRAAIAQRAIAARQNPELAEPADPWASANPIPIRAVLAVLATAVCLVLLLSFKTPDLPPTTSLGIGDPNAGGGGGVGGGLVVPNGGAGVGASSAPSVAPSAPNVSSLPTGTLDVTGPAEETPFGDVQVEIKLTAGKVSDIVAVQLPSGARRSVEINQYAAPILHDEALQAQSAQIQGVSGATYTSDGYERSLQAALDQAHSS